MKWRIGYMLSVGDERQVTMTKQTFNEHKTAADTVQTGNALEARASRNATKRGGLLSGQIDEAVTVWFCRPEYAVGMKGRIMFHKNMRVVVTPKDHYTPPGETPEQPEKADKGIIQNGQTDEVVFMAVNWENATADLLMSHGNVALNVSLFDFGTEKLAEWA